GERHEAGGAGDGGAARHGGGDLHRARRRRLRHHRHRQGVGRGAGDRPCRGRGRRRLRLPLLRPRRSGGGGEDRGARLGDRRRGRSGGEQCRRRHARPRRPARSCARELGPGAHGQYEGALLPHPGPGEAHGGGGCAAARAARHRLRHLGQCRARQPRPGGLLREQGGALHGGALLRAPPRGGRHPRLRGPTRRHPHGDDRGGGRALHPADRRRPLADPPLGRAGGCGPGHRRAALRRHPLLHRRCLPCRWRAAYRPAL
ncbi:MAG: 3-oxoacyl-[acyl-carrier protein] reductase, partial [uncultured Craurococcus sp.]